MKLKNFLKIEGEKPLDNLVEDGGYAKIFRTIACIGDSLSSGEFESTNPAKTETGYTDMYEYSWGQFMARTLGSRVYNFSAGGLTAFEYLDSYADAKDLWNEEKKAQAYILALGVNDLLGNKPFPVGNLSDINLEDYNKNAQTFCGLYAKIIQKYKKIQPHAKFFLMTMPKENDGKNDKREAHAKLLRELANFFDYTYVLDFYEYAPVYDDNFKKNFYLGGHLNPMGYILTAKMTASYIDYIIRNNMEDFIQVPFIGIGYHNHNAKW